MTNNTFKKHFEKAFFNGKRIPTGIYGLVLFFAFFSLALALTRRFVSLNGRIFK